MHFSERGRTSCLLAMGLCLMLSSVPGCGGGPKTGQVGGTVTLDGNPLTEGVVTFEDPVKGRGGSATLKGGVFQFETPLNAGEYKVVVQPPPPPPPTAAPPPNDAPKVTIPEKFQQSASSELTATVKEGVNKFEFKLVP